MFTKVPNIPKFNIDLYIEDFNKKVQELKRYILEAQIPYISIIHDSVSTFGLVLWFTSPGESTITEHKDRCNAVNEYMIEQLKDCKVFNDFFEIFVCFYVHGFSF